MVVTTCSYIIHTQNNIVWLVAPNILLSDDGHQRRLLETISIVTGKLCGLCYCCPPATLLLLTLQARIRDRPQGAGLEEGGGPHPGRRQVQRLHVHPAGAVQYSTVQYSTVQYSTVQYSDYISTLQDEFKNNHMEFIMNRKFPKEAIDMKMVTKNKTPTALRS